MLLHKTGSEIRFTFCSARQRGKIHCPSEEDCMQISFIGAGKVGVSLGKYFISKGRKVGGYYSLSPKSAAWAANFTNTKQYQSIEEIISSSDMIFLPCPMIKSGKYGRWQNRMPTVKSLHTAAGFTVQTSFLI